MKRFRGPLVACEVMYTPHKRGVIPNGYARRRDDRFTTHQIVVRRQTWNEIGVRPDRKKLPPPVEYRIVRDPGLKVIQVIQCTDTPFAHAVA